MSGDPVCIGIACAIAASNNMGRFNLLKWDRLEETYYPLKVDIYQKETKHGL